MNVTLLCTMYNFSHNMVSLEINAAWSRGAIRPFAVFGPPDRMYQQYTNVTAHAIANTTSAPMIANTSTVLLTVAAAVVTGLIAQGFGAGVGWSIGATYDCAGKWVGSLLMGSLAAVWTGGGGGGVGAAVEKAGGCGATKQVFPLLIVKLKWNKLYNLILDKLGKVVDTTGCVEIDVELEGFVEMGAVQIK